MSSHLTLVALANTVVSDELHLALIKHAKVLGIELTKGKPEKSNSTYFTARWTCSQALPPEARVVMRDIAAAHDADLAFLSPDFKPNEVKVLAMDMDSTLINIECIDEIADFTGKKAAVSEITEATMRGEIKDFKESLRRRVALLEGVSADVLESVYQERLRPNPGATELLSGANARGLYTLLVSGGFTFFTKKLQQELGFKQTQANTLEIIDGKLTGKVIGDIVDGAAKSAYLEQACSLMGCDKKNSITMGDGSNDLPMMHGSGISIAYRAKPIVKEKADAAFDRVGLDAALLLLA
ncbi:phosphoserine phosphatase SerB [Polynucleobacter sp. AP-Ainpum-60-G11]|uniref:phosphoserine phosphatase SerB n=1 Tax=Polynucleobacter sp. AP-Ainpum-60-G11 TaxID=2576926 RepID=UPI001BFD606E|nr:phosphoserine phosphatase SerB [Polynucleobacter sp. AP-Ainpum-60-G11]QWE27588.1 phosphoserine phosphatase SerB [Polynucleobacter sp. AP-Ainpum-60-G11]